MDCTVRIAAERDESTLYLCDQRYPNRLPAPAWCGGCEREGDVDNKSECTFVYIVDRRDVDRLVEFVDGFLAAHQWRIGGVAIEMWSLPRKRSW